MLCPAVAGGLPPEGCTASHTPSFSLKRLSDEENMSSSVRPGGGGEDASEVRQTEGDGQRRNKGDTHTRREEKCEGEREGE